MRKRDSSLRELAESIGCVMFLSWVLLLGPLGFLLFSGLACSAVVQNLALGIVVGLILFLPLALTLVWTGIIGAEAIRSRFSSVESKSRPGKSLRS